MNNVLAFSDALRAVLQRPSLCVTPGLLSKLTGIPKATIVNWLDGRVACPRSPHALPLICDALRLDASEARMLHASVGIELDPSCDDGTFDGVPVGLYVTSVEGKILAANATLVRMLGYRSREEYLSLDVGRDLYATPGAREAWLSEMSRRGTLARVPVVARRADGSEVRLLDTASAVRDDRGRVRFEGVWELEGCFGAR